VRFRELVATVCENRYASANAARFGEIEDWDVSQVEDVSLAFFDRDVSRASSFASPWRDDAPTDTSLMFFSAIRSNQPLGRCDVGRVEDAYSFCKSMRHWTNAAAAAVEPRPLYT